MSDEAKTDGHLFEVDHDAVLREKFASGQGVIELQPNMINRLNAVLDQMNASIERILSLAGNRR